MRFEVYVYVDGYDLYDVAVSIKRRLDEIACSFPEVRVVDDRFERTPDMHTDDLPTWNLGLNFNLSQVSARFVGAVLERIRALSHESGRSFAVGYYDSVSKIDQDIGFIESDTDCGGILRVLESLATSG
jgi:hypothetical protein